MTTIREQYRTNIILDLDFRKGSIYDNSNYANDVATVQGTVLWTKGEKGRATMFNSPATGYFIVNDAVNLRPSNLTICCFGNFDSQNNSERFVYKRGANANYDFYCNATSLGIYDGTNVSTLVVDIKGSTMVAVSVTSGQKPDFFKDGVFVGQGSLTITPNTTNTPNMNIGAEGAATNINRNPFYEVLIFNTVLTKQEISQLYEEWLQEGEYSVTNILSFNNPSRTFIADGDMEAADTTSWTVHNNATLSKQTTTPHGGTQCLRIAYNGTNYPAAKQLSILTAGKTYRCTGWMRGDGSGTGYPQIYCGSLDYVNGTNSNTWQYFDFIRTCNSAYNYFYCYDYATAASYVELDDVKIEEVPPSCSSYISDGRGWNSTLANETSGFLGNSFWRISSGTWSITDSLQKINGNQILADANMETSGTAAWNINYGNPTLSKQGGAHSGTQCLRVAYNGTTNPWVGQTNTLTVGKKYRLKGWARGDGTRYPTVWLSNGTTYDWLGTASTDWQYFDIAGKTTMAALTPYFMTMASEAGYAEFDDVELYEVLQEGHKIQNVSSGMIYRPSEIVSGTWEFEVYKGSGTSSINSMLLASQASTWNTAGQNGYDFGITLSENVGLYKITNGVATTLCQSAAGYIAGQGWNKFKITRTTVGVFSMYIYLNGVWTLIPVTTGSNPVTDTTYTTSMFSVIELTTGDHIRNLNFKSYI